MYGLEANGIGSFIAEKLDDLGLRYAFTTVTGSAVYSPKNPRPGERMQELRVLCNPAFIDENGATREGSICLQTARRPKSEADWRTQNVADPVDFVNGGTALEARLRGADQEHPVQRGHLVLVHSR